MSDPDLSTLPLPKAQPSWWAQLRYSLAVGKLRYLNYAVYAAGLLAVALSLIWLSGLTAPRWEKLADTENVLPRQHWPEIPDAVKPMVLGEDGNPATLNLIDVRNRMIEVDANARHADRGEPVTDLPVPASDKAAPQVYLDWASASACSLTEWPEPARAQAAALIRNGVWQCPGWRRTLAWLPLVVQLGHWKGFLLTLVMFVGLLGAGWVVVRLLRHHLEVVGLHRKLFGSWVK